MTATARTNDIRHHHLQYLVRPFVPTVDVGLSDHHLLELSVGAVRSHNDAIVLTACSWHKLELRICVLHYSHLSAGYKKTVPLSHGWFNLANSVHFSSSCHIYSFLLTFMFCFYRHEMSQFPSHWQLQNLFYFQTYFLTWNCSTFSAIIAVLTLTLALTLIIDVCSIFMSFQHDIGYIDGRS